MSTCSAPKPSSCFLRFPKGYLWESLFCFEVEPSGIEPKPHSFQLGVLPFTPKLHVRGLRIHPLVTVFRRIMVSRLFHDIPIVSVMPGCLRQPLLMISNYSTTFISGEICCPTLRYLSMKVRSSCELPNHLVLLKKPSLKALSY